MQGLLEIITKEMRSASTDTPAIFIHNCDGGGKGIGELIGAAVTVNAEEAFKEKKPGSGEAL